MRRINSLFKSVSSKKPRELGIAGLLLVILSRVYEAAVRTRLLMYRLGIFRIVKVKGVRVISVGNITVGGSGKTPVTMSIARMLKETGEKVAVISRGYGRRSREPVQVVSDGTGPLASYPDASDEALLCAQTLDGVPVISAPGRTEAIRTARDTFGASVALLDDGFSHLAAGRDKNILLLDALNPFGNGQMLPAGPLREPLSSIARADAVIITRAGAATPERIGQIKKDVKSRAHGGIPVFTCDINAEDVIDPGGARHAAKKFLNGRRVCLLSGIASPEQFEQMVKILCSSIPEHFAYEDHHRFTDEEMKTLIDDKLEGSLLLTTEKDFVRLPPFAKIVAHRLTISAKINEEEPGDFIKYLLL